MLEINPKSKNAKRDICKKLDELGCFYEYSLKGVRITAAPKPHKMLIQKILQEYMGFQKKVNTRNVLLFLKAYYELEDFNSAPAGEKVLMLKKEYNIEISEHTCRD